MGKFAVAGAPTRRRVIGQAGTLALGVAAPSLLRVGPAFAAYPDRAIKIVVPNTPGGPSDIIARILAASLQGAIGGSVVVENKGGGGSNIGMGYVARADGDGYTLLLATSAYAVNPGLYETLPYDPFKDFAPIAELATSPNVFAVKPELGVRTMKEFIALAKSDPSSTSRPRRSAPRRNWRPRYSRRARASPRWPASCSPAAARRCKRCSATPSSSPPECSHRPIPRSRAAM